MMSQMKQIEVVEISHLPLEMVAVMDQIVNGHVRRFLNLAGVLEAPERTSYMLQYIWNKE
jgi:hypothetical protein